ncbi:NAD(P)H-binding protein [Sphingomonas sp.]|uniref:NAD(P)H-binding protein n=1 Tax=Sphingomonas sp. TaxID=28214 RepID=UPI003D6D35B2
MKIILTGATGFVGSEVLTQLLADPKVTQVTALSRRPLSQTHDKLVTIVQEDFSRYDDAVIERISDHVGCIWTLGGPASDIGEGDLYVLVTHTFTTTFAEAIASHTKGRFTFCYVSGMGADPTESTILPWERTTRHIKGRTEKDLGLIQARHTGMALRVFRPGGIIPKGSNSLVYALVSGFSIRVEELAKGLIIGATDPLVRGARTLSNGEIKKVARGAKP